VALLLRQRLKAGWRRKRSDFNAQIPVLRLTPASVHAAALASSAFGFDAQSAKSLTSGKSPTVVLARSHINRPPLARSAWEQSSCRRVKPSRVANTDCLTGREFGDCRGVRLEGQCVPYILTYGPSHLRAPPVVDWRGALPATEAFWRDWSAKSTYAGRWRQPMQRSLLTGRAPCMGRRRPAGATWIGYRRQARISSRSVLLALAVRKFIFRLVAALLIKRARSNCNVVVQDATGWFDNHPAGGEKPARGRHSGRVYLI
jgi:hypothetical protein